MPLQSDVCTMIRPFQFYVSQTNQICIGTRVTGKKKMSFNFHMFHFKKQYCVQIDQFGTSFLLIVPSPCFSVFWTCQVSLFHTHSSNALRITAHMLDLRISEQSSLMPRPRPLMRKKGSGDLRLIPWLY